MTQLLDEAGRVVDRATGRTDRGRLDADHVLLRTGMQPALAQQAPHLGGMPRLARDTRTVSRRVIPLLGEKRGTRLNPASMTARTLLQPLSEPPRVASKPRSTPA